jgi:hypothetical protein
MANSYFQLFAQAMSEMNDPEFISVEDDFVRSLCEVSLCLLMSHLRPQSTTAPLDFPANLFPGIVDYIPVIDIYEQTPRPDLLVPLAIRDSNNVELTRGSISVIKYFDDSWIATTTVPTEYYFLLTNLVGVRRAPISNIEFTLTYVPYIEIVDIQDIFPLDKSYEDKFVCLVRMFLLLRFSNFESSLKELERFLS